MEPSRSGPSGTAPPSPSHGATELLVSVGGDVLGRDPARAVECFREAIRLAAAEGDAAGAARAGHRLAAAELDRGRHTEAHAALDPALARAREQDDACLVAACLNTLGLLRLKEGHPDDARIHLRESLGRTSDASSDAGTALTRAETLETLGLVDREAGEPRQAYLYFQEALEARRAAHDESGVASCRNHLGSLCYRMGRFEDAVGHFEEALEVRRSLGDRSGIASTANNLAGALLQQGKLRESSELFEESRRIVEELGETRRLASILSNLGLLRTYQGRVEEAGDHHRESLRLHRETGDLTGQAHALNNLASLEVEQGRPEDALRHADACVELWRKAGRLGNLAKPLVNRGDALLELGRADEARQAAEEALEAADRARSEEYRAEGSAVLASARLKQGDFEGALAAARQSLEHASAAGSPHLEASCHTVLGRVHAEAGELEAAKLALERSSRLLRGIPHPFERARVLEEQGLLLARVGADEAGAERMRRALEEFELLGNARWRTRVLTELATVVAPRDPDAARGYREEARMLAARHGLEGHLAAMEAKAAARRDAARGSAGGLDELASRMLETTARRTDGPAACVEAFEAFVRHHAGDAAVSLRWSAPLDWPEADGARKAAPVDVVLAIPVGAAPEPLGNLRVARAAPFDGNDTAWWQTAARILALALEGHADRRGRETLPAAAVGAPASREGFEGFVGRSPPMRDVYRLIEQVAPGRTSALLLGESGTGKELAARAIHARSSRRKGAFVAINCPSIPRDLIESELFGHEKGAFTGAASARPGKVEAADGGTLFLDEVGDMSPSAQVKLLRFLEEREFQRVGGNRSRRVDVRILAATSRDLEEAVAGGTFREDLYYRLNVVPIRMPSLRERREDLPGLATYLLTRLAAGAAVAVVPRLTARAMDRLLAHDWPGNVRELRNTLEYMVTVAPGDVLDEEHVPTSIRRGWGTDGTSSVPGLRAGETMASRLQQLEATLIRSTLEAEDWNQSSSARRLGITESKIRNRMKQFGIRRPSDPRTPGDNP